MGAKEEVMQRSRTAQYLTQIERHERHPLVLKILSQRTTFQGEVENFYGLSTWLGYFPRGGLVREFRFEYEDSTKKGKFPRDLVEVLGAFSPEQLDSSKLEYNSVREDYERWNATSRKVKRGILGAGSMLSAIGGLSACLIGAIEGNPEIAVPGGIIGAGGMGTVLWTILYYPKPKGSNDELGEYLKLHNSAQIADGFMENHYRKHFVRKVLSNFP